jgi:hypothetical protein
LSNPAGTFEAGVARHDGGADVGRSERSRPGYGGAAERQRIFSVAATEAGIARARAAFDGDRDVNEEFEALRFSILSETTWACVAEREATIAPARAASNAGMR